MSNKRQMKKMTAEERSKRNTRKAAARVRRSQGKTDLAEVVKELDAEARLRAINIEVARPADLIGLAVEDAMKGRVQKALQDNSFGIPGIGL